MTLPDWTTYQPSPSDTVLSLGRAPRKVLINSIKAVSAGDRGGVSIASAWLRLLARATEAVSAASIAISIAGVKTRRRLKLFVALLASAVTISPIPYVAVSARLIQGRRIVAISGGISAAIRMFCIAFLPLTPGASTCAFRGSHL